VLALFNALAAEVLPTPVVVRNPLWDRTRAEGLGLLREHGVAALLWLTHSCSHARGRPRHQPFCGYCSQCVDRRFGVLAAHVEEHDPVSRYALDVFVQCLPEGEPRTVALSYVQFARTVRQLSDDTLFNDYPQLIDALPG